MSMFSRRPDQELPRFPKSPAEGASEALEQAAAAATDAELIDCLLRAVGYLADGDLGLYRLLRAVRESRR